MRRMDRMPSIASRAPSAVPAFSGLGPRSRQAVLVSRLRDAGSWLLLHPTYPIHPWLASARRGLLPHTRSLRVEMPEAARPDGVASGMNPLRLTVLAAVSSLGVVASASEVPVDPAHQVASAYGIANWDRIDRVDFTFHVEMAGGKVVDRAWSWEPERDGGTVTLNPGSDAALRFHTSDGAEAGSDLEKAQWNFVNDSYWLAFPFQLVWSDPQVELHGKTPMPISAETAWKKTATWPAEGGYTPGDAYDLWHDEDGRIVEWVFRRASGAEGRPATWENARTAAGVTFATEHHGPEGSGFLLSFPQLRVWADGNQEPIVLRGEQ